VFYLKKLWTLHTKLNTLPVRNTSHVRHQTTNVGTMSWHPLNTTSTPHTMGLPHPLIYRMTVTPPQTDVTCQLMSYRRTPCGTSVLCVILKLRFLKKTIWIFLGNNNLVDWYDFIIYLQNTICEMLSHNLNRNIFETLCYTLSLKLYWNCMI